MEEELYYFYPNGGRTQDFTLPLPLSRIASDLHYAIPYILHIKFYYCKFLVPFFFLYCIDIEVHYSELSAVITPIR